MNQEIKKDFEILKDKIDQYLDDKITSKEIFSQLDYCKSYFYENIVNKDVEKDLTYLGKDLIYVEKVTLEDAKLILNNLVDAFNQLYNLREHVLHVIASVFNTTKEEENIVKIIKARIRVLNDDLLYYDSSFSIEIKELEKELKELSEEDIEEIEEEIEETVESIKSKLEIKIEIFLCLYCYYKEFADTLDRTFKFNIKQAIIKMESKYNKLMECIAPYNFNIISLEHLNAQKSLKKFVSHI